MYSYFALCSVAAVAKTLLISLLSSQWLPLGDFISLYPFARSPVLHFGSRVAGYVSSVNRQAKDSSPSTPPFRKK